MYDVTWMPKAPTLKNLRDRIDEAIKIVGEDAPWNGWDQGDIHIYNDEDEIELVIESQGGQEVTMTLDETIKHCDQRIKIRGAGARIYIKMFGRWGATDTRKLCRGGPTGQIHADLVDGRHILVAFSAAEVKTHLEGIKNGSITG